MLNPQMDQWPTALARRPHVRVIISLRNARSGGPPAHLPQLRFRSSALLFVPFLAIAERHIFHGAALGVAG